MFQMDRRRFLRTSAVVAAAVGGAAAFAACAPATASSTVLRVGSTTDIDSLNPFTAFSTQAYDVLQLIYDKLMDYDAKLDVSPSLATGVDTTDGGRTWTYTLREGVTWTDGTAFSADDVVFTFLMVRDNAYGTYGAYLTELTDVVKVDDTTVRLTYSTPQTLPRESSCRLSPNTFGRRWPRPTCRDSPTTHRSAPVRSSSIRGTRAVS
ncbi:hypothetical protein BVC93_21425 [Mycobacterium sp. MS1601]|nr:hypothetical protein BVC93_21425 [Mycobacterium sp. MS1601]